LQTYLQAEFFLLKPGRY